MPEMTKAERAVAHLIKRIQRDARLAYHICPMTESFGLLTEAYAEMRGLNVDEFKTEYGHTLKFEE